MQHAQFEVQNKLEDFVGSSLCRRNIGRDFVMINISSDSTPLKVIPPLLLTQQTAVLPLNHRYSKGWLHKTF